MVRKGCALCVGEFKVAHLPPRSTVRRQTTVVISCKHLLGWERDREEEGRGRVGRQKRTGRGRERGGEGEGGWKRKDIRKDESDTLGMYVVYKQCGETMYRIN